jgi:hypothetical protein
MTGGKSLRGFPHYHGYGDDCHISEDRQSPPKTRNQSHSHRKGLVNRVPGLKRKGCPGTLMGIGFVSLTEAFDMTTPIGRALAGMLAVFAEFEREILRERVKAGIADARAKGIVLGRPKSAAKKAVEVRRLYRKERLTKSEIATRLGIGRTSVRRFLGG